MKIKRFSFQGSQGDELSAQLDLPDGGQPAAYALFAHCFTCTKNLKLSHSIDRALTERGIGVLRFDFTGLGESEGDFADTNFSSNVGDLVAAARFLQAEYGPPSLLIGHSLGGAAVLQAAHSIPDCVAVVTIAAPADLAHLGQILLNESEEVDGTGEREITLGGVTFRIKQQLLDDLEEKNMQQTIARLDKPLLILHSPHDDTVDIESAYEIFRTAQQPKSIVSLDRASHLLTDERDGHYAGVVIAAWASKYLASLGVQSGSTARRGVQ